MEFASMKPIVSAPAKPNLSKPAFAVLALLATMAVVLPAQTVTTLFSFDGTDGAGPGALVQGTDGNLYGTSYGGGANSYGTAFQITPAGTLTTLYSFCAQTNCPDGDSPRAGLVQATNGNLYGTTSAGGVYALGPYTNYGTVFRISPDGTLTTLYSFCAQSGCPDGGSPNGLVQAASGDLYGTTVYGGNGTVNNNYGTIFKITPSGTLTTLYRFCPLQPCPDGKNPTVGLVQGTDRSLYGTTSSGGIHDGAFGGAGTIFKITPAGKLTTLHHFCAPASSACTDGRLPSGLVQAANGNFYGTAFEGGAGT